ncbi:prolipoprotein diacylglyceryl transferase [Patescibacteria group bacterium]|nr:prolipoprotein diacylglyceryl transferase [Patescibacteria group bacterium]
MFNLFFDFLHNFKPQPIILRLGVFNIYWYSCLIVFGLLLGLILVFKLNSRFSAKGAVSAFGARSASGGNIKKQLLENLFFYLIISGFLGARLYHVLSEFPYYLKYPWQVFAVWQGGLGIYGAVIVGTLVLFWFCKKYKLRFLSLADLLVPSLILGQAIGRWGNYFNQEVFGKPTNLPWGIPIKIIARPSEFLSAQYFHPTFLYESIWNFLIFIMLIWAYLYFSKFRSDTNIRIHTNDANDSNNNSCGRIRVSRAKGRGLRYSGAVFALYLILYSFGRFFLEFLRIDSQPMLLGLRLAQVVAIVLFVVGWGILMRKSTKQLSN